MVQQPKKRVGWDRELGWDDSLAQLDSIDLLDDAEDFEASAAQVEDQVLRFEQQLAETLLRTTGTLAPSSREVDPAAATVAARKRRGSPPKAAAPKAKPLAEVAAVKPRWGLSTKQNVGKAAGAQAGRNGVKEAAATAPLPPSREEAAPARCRTAAPVCSPACPEPSAPAPGSSLQEQCAELSALVEELKAQVGTLQEEVEQERSLRAILEQRAAHAEEGQAAAERALELALEASTDMSSPGAHEGVVDVSMSDVPFPNDGQAAWEAALREANSAAAAAPLLGGGLQTTVLSTVCPGSSTTGRLTVCRAGATTLRRRLPRRALAGRTLGRAGPPVPDGAL